jgi:hypothetical protein
MEPVRLALASEPSAFIRAKRLDRTEPKALRPICFNPKTMATPNSLETRADAKSPRDDIGKIGRILVILLVLCLGLVAGVGFIEGKDYFWHNYAIAALWALAYCAGGFLIGFLFGIPKVLQGDEDALAKEKSAKTSDKPEKAGNASPTRYRVNTNLEQISDWLTKIIVGLGLVQLRNLPKNLYDAATWMARSFAASEANLGKAASCAGSIIVLFSVTGFIAGYLMTRLYLAGAFRRADTPTTEQITASGYSDDDASTQLTEFWKPNGIVNLANEKLLLDWMTKEGLITGDKKISVPLFLNAPEYLKQRAQAMQDLIGKK